MQKSDVLGRAAMLTELGFSPAQARNLVQTEVELSERDGEGELEFERRSQRRVGFRRRWWRRLALVQIAILGLVNWTVFERVNSIESMGLELAPPLGWLLDPKLVLYCSFTLFLSVGYRRHPEDLLEEEARMCWRLKAMLARGVSYHNAIMHFSKGWRGCRGIFELFEAAWFQGRVPEVAHLWARKVEWALDLRQERREQHAARWWFALAGANLWLWWEVSRELASYGCIGCLG